MITMADVYSFMTTGQDIITHHQNNNNLAKSKISSFDSSTFGLFLEKRWFDRIIARNRVASGCSRRSGC